MITDIVFYGAPVVAIAITVWIGWLGLLFYIREILQDKDT